MNMLLTFMISVVVSVSVLMWQAIDNTTEEKWVNRVESGNRIFIKQKIYKCKKTSEDFYKFRNKTWKDSILKLK